LVKHLKHIEIDKQKWDNCIDTSSNGTIYALSWYLDIVNPGWEALVEGDYDTVMPLPVRKKYGFTYLIQPFLTQQLGIISKIFPDERKVNEFINIISKKFKFININLNQSNYCIDQNFNIIPRNNHELDLAHSFNEIEKKFSRRTKRNIKNAESANVRIVENVSAIEFTKFKSKYSEPKLNNRFKDILKKLIEYSTNKSMGKVLAAKDQNDNIISAAFYMYYKNRIYFSVTASSKLGKTTSAMHLILNKIIEDNSETNKTLDFTGSNLKGVAYFNEGFGAKPSQYQNIHLNKLNRLIRLVKK
jgi:lipid II:glycine glycyltransferase (peptidoglycan interpeptide bridge formation enzyme)